MMKELGIGFAELKSRLWASKLGQLVNVLKARTTRLSVPEDFLAVHEGEARKRGDPAYYDRVQEMKRRESKQHHNPWA